MLKSLSLAPGVALDGAGSFGEIGNFVDGFIFTDMQDFRKALTSGNGTDAATFTQGRALQMESLEPVLISQVEDQKEDFPLFDMLAKGDATSVVDQWTRQDSIGGFPGDSTNTETGTISEATGKYVRKTDEVKFLMSKFAVSVVQQATKSMIDSLAAEQQSALLRLLRSASHMFYYGDSDIVPTEFSGILKIIAEEATSRHVYDMRGASISPDFAAVHDLAAIVRDQENFGRLTQMMCSNLMKADINKIVAPAFRINIDGSRRDDIKHGAVVKQLITDQGNIDITPDIWLKEGQAPFVARGGDYPQLVTDAAVTAPASLSGTAASDANSQFTSAHAGLYYYAVEAVNNKGRSSLVKSSQITVAAGDKVTLTITAGASGGGNETGYVIHRSKLNGGNANGDFREMVRVAKDSTTTTYVDLNQNIPGTSSIVLLDMLPGHKAITMQRLLPLTKFPLATVNTATHNAAMLLFLYLRIAAPRKHAVIKNLVPTGATWKPF